MASTNSDFVVKNGLVVNTNLIWANSGKVGINNSAPDANLTVTGTANISGKVTLSANAVINGRLDVNNVAYIDTRLYVGNTETMVTLTNPIIQAVDNFNGFVQVSSQNLSKEDDACADLLIYADNTNGLTYFNDVGLNNSRFDGRIHRVSANTLADNLILGETVFQSNGTANIAVGVLLNVTVINSTSRSVAVAVANGGSFVNTAGGSLALSGVSSLANASILVAVPFGTVSEYSRRNYPFTIGIRTDGYLYQANSALTIGTTEGGVRSTNQAALTSGVTFTTGSNTITCSNTSLLYPELVIEGSGIPANTRIVSVTNSTSFKINKQTTTANSGSYTFTDPAYDAAGNPIIFHTNGMLAENEIARFSGNGNLTLGTNTVSRNSKLTVDGNANVVGNVVVGNSLVTTGAANLQSTLRVAGSANLVGSATLSNTLTVTGNVTFSNLVTTTAAGITIGSATVNSTNYTGTAANATLLNNQTGAFYTNATNLSTGTLNNSRLPSVATTITQVGTLTGLTVSGNTVLPGLSLTTNATANVISVTSANVNIDSGVMFVDGVNNRVGINNSTPDAALTVTGSANVSGNLRIAGDLLVDGATVSVGETVSQGDFIPISNSFNLGNTTSRWGLYGSFINIDSPITVGVSTTNAVVNTTAVAFNNSTVTGTLTALNYSGTAANATLFNNQSASFYTNANNLTAGVIAPARLPQANATTNGAVLILDSVSNTSVAIYAAAPNSVKTAYDAAISANTRAASAQSAAVDAFNNAVSFATSQASQAYTNAITYSGNAAAAYANAIAFSGNAALAYANAISFAANATNLTNGTIPYARIPANVINTTASFTRTGITTFSANVILGSSGLSANGTFGIDGSVLRSNGTATYWGSTSAGVTQISAANGLTGGIISDVGTIAVNGGSGITVNTTGVHVVAGNTLLISNSTGVWANQQNFNHNVLANYVADEHVAHTGVSITAGSGLTGGGTIASSRTLSVVAGNTQLISNSTGVWANQAAFNHNALSNYVSAQHVDHSTIQIIAGAGLAGGGDLTASRTLSLDQATIDHNSLLNYVADEHIAHSGVSILAGNGLTGGGTIAASRTLTVGAGNGVSVTADAVSVLGGSTLTVNSSGAHVNSTYIAGATVNKADNLVGGGANRIPYQTGAGATSFLAAGTSGQILTSGGTNAAPSWTNLDTSALTANNTTYFGGYTTAEIGSRLIASDTLGAAATTWTISWTDWLGPAPNMMKIYFRGLRHTAGSVRFFNIQFFDGAWSTARYISNSEDLNNSVSGIIELSRPYGTTTTTKNYSVLSSGTNVAADLGYGDSIDIGRVTSIRFSLSGTGNITTFSDAKAYVYVM